MRKRLATFTILSALIATLAAPLQARAFEPVADKICQLTADQSRQRQDYLLKELESARADVGLAESSLRSFEELLGSYNSAYTVSKWLSAGAAAAFTIATAGAGWKAGAGVLMLGTVGYLGSDAISQILGTDKLRVLTIEEEFLAIVDPSKVTTPAQVEFYADEQFDPIRALVSSPRCGPSQCAPWHPYIERMMALGEKVWKSELRRLEREDAWYKFDAFTRLEGRKIAEAHIPYAKMMVALTRGKVKFYEAILKTLRHDAYACRTRG